MAQKLIQFKLNEKDIIELKKMKEELGLTSMADLVRSSLRLSKTITEENRKGSKIIIREKNGQEKEILII